MIDYTKLMQSPRLLMEAELRPAQGSRFQPTGFADIGAAEYTRPDPAGKEGIPMLLVESAQSVANRLEKTCLDGDGPDLDPELAGIPYVAANLTREGSDPIRTTSLVEAHRLASPYFLKGPYQKQTFGEFLSGEMGYTAKGPLNWKKIYSALFRYDVNALIHGVFLSLLGDGRVRVPRAVTGFIEAENVKQAISGGVKNSPVDPKGEVQVNSTEKVEKGIYSNVPFSRVEYVADSIRAYFNLDLALIRGYGLPEPATRLIVALSMLKIQRFLKGHLRLRTACDLDLCGMSVQAPAGFAMPSAEELLREVQTLIPQCKEQFANPPVTELTVPTKLVPKPSAQEDADA